MANHLSRIVQGWGAGRSCAYCHGFQKIPTLIRGTDGRWHMNPDREQIKDFSVRAEPWGRQLQPGESFDFAITPPAEDEDLGDFLIQELREAYTPAGSRSLTIEFLSLQTSKTLQNAPVFTTLMIGNSHLNCCLPCCTLVQATNTLLMRVTNLEAVPVDVRITAHGQRFIPRSPELRQAMLEYWNAIPSYPYFLTLDDQEVLVPAGEQVEAFMTVPGAGDFEVKYPRCEVLPAGVGPVDADDIEIQVIEGIGRALQSGPVRLGSFFATPTLAVTGFPGGLYRAASACSCPPARQLFKRNNRIRHVMRNEGANDAIVRITYAGCFHKVDECGPVNRNPDAIRSLEPTIGPLLIPQRDCPPEATYAPVEAAFHEPLPAPAPSQLVPVGAGNMVPSAGPRTMFVPGSGTIVEGQSGQLEYLWKYYEPGPDGVARPKGELAQAHGLPAGRPYVPPRPGAIPGMSGMPGPARPVQRGGRYYDPFARTWRQA